MSKKKETIWGETLDVEVTEAGKSAARLRRAGVGAKVRLTRRAMAHGVGGASDGVIVGWGRDEWTVRVKTVGRKTSSSYHVRFWAPVRRPAQDDRREGDVDE